MQRQEGARVFIILGLLLLLATAAAAARDPMAAADELLENAQLSLPQVQAALNLYQEARPGTRAEQVSWMIRMARSSFLAGELAEKAQRQDYYRQGQDYAERIIREQPAAVAGHYWLALNLCGQADCCRNLQALRMLPRIVEELRAALALDETYDQAGPHRVLGRIYFEAPSWPVSVGDPQKSRQHLAAAVRLAPGNSTNHLYLAETLLQLQYYHQAQLELKQVITSTHHALRAQELEKDREKAQELLREGKSLWDQGPKGSEAQPSPSS